MQAHNREWFKKWTAAEPVPLCVQWLVLVESRESLVLHGIVSDRIEERVVSCCIVSYCIVCEVRAGNHSGGIEASRAAIRWAS
ncbi:hypothetical protein CFAM422_002775 [Trichoderma lentiforme]|uniref:Uncharacterized protein n=1 Tax=Trichoderma lentiforme TaxID=1567552 RepID=A0A9P5CGM1_9HYPO|nr:hypothetical protein CFAM422_002775 [Trichoderma lentiforme]